MLNASLVYVLINKIALFRNPVHYVNFISSIIFMFSLAFFLKNTPNRWLALAISFPIIILILGMGYARQGLAFSFSLFLIKALEDKKILKSILFIFLSILSHKSALFFSSILLFLFSFLSQKIFLFIIVYFYSNTFWNFFGNFTVIIFIFM